ncbi:hypothetical protein H9L39_16974 [Fusarium oxysporum f. sp. albedinis]|nr:hypothetical protein H9L39_16974 [Fusarium oxysporum f. sp. albedinis]
MVANVQHVAKLLPPSPPVSEETGDQSATSATTIASESETSSISLDLNISERDEDHLSPLSHLTRQQAYGSGIEPYESASLMLSRSGLAFIAEVLGRFVSNPWPLPRIHEVKKTVRKQLYLGWDLDLVINYWRQCSR